MSLTFFALGALGWNASEYLIHRFIGHGPKRKAVGSLLARLTPRGLAAEFNREHLAHHTDPTYFAPTERKVLAAAAVVPVMGLALAPVVGPRRAVSFSLGFAAAYGFYEVVHRRIHTHPPTGAYSRWLRRHHLYHNYKTPRDNHGVTSPLFDLAFGTKKPLERVRVPRRTAPVWMLDDDGEVRAAYADDYEAVGASRPERAATEDRTGRDAATAAPP